MNQYFETPVEDISDIPQPTLAKDMPAVNKTTGIVAGLAMIAVGIAAAFAPMATGIALAYLITAGLGVYGGAQVLAFLRAPKELRSGWTLASGVVLAGFSIFTLWTSVQTAYGAAGMISALASVAAFFTVLGGIGQLLRFSEFREHGTEGAGWVLAGGVLNILMGLILLTNPLISWFALSTVWGIYLGVSGLALLAESLSGRRGCRAKT